MSKYITPLRYPGGKQKLTPFIRNIISQNKLIGCDYVEPYAGGAGVALELLINGDVSNVHLNDACKAIYAFWGSILKEPDAFCKRIYSASLTVEEWRKQKEILNDEKNSDTLDLGFSFFYLNRCNRSGILSGGLIGGLKQEGVWKMDARFPRNELIRRIELIALHKKHIKIKNWDAEKYIKQYIPTLPQKTLIYFDPPYYKKASHLYLNYYKPEDHAIIADVIQKSVKRPWVMSYDNVPEISKLYRKKQKCTLDIQYNAAKVHKGKEIFIFSDKVTKIK